MSLFSCFMALGIPLYIWTTSLSIICWWTFRLHLCPGYCSLARPAASYCLILSSEATFLVQLLSPSDVFAPSPSHTPPPRFHVLPSTCYSLKSLCSFIFSCVRSQSWYVSSMGAGILSSHHGCILNVANGACHVKAVLKIDVSWLDGWWVF